MSARQVLLERVETALGSSPVGGAFRVEDVKRLIVEMQGLLDENAELRKDRGRDWVLRDQKMLDAICHYRNLAITLGAKPEQMLDQWDRDLCVQGIATDHIESLVGCWDEAFVFEAEAARLWKLLDEARAELKGEG